MTYERKHVFSVSDEERGLLAELATLKEKQAAVAAEIQAYLNTARIMDGNTDIDARSEVHEQLNRLNTESHTINIRCNEIYYRLQVLTKNRTVS